MLAQLRIMQEASAKLNERVKKAESTTETLEAEITAAKKEKFQAVEIISTISAVIALVLVFTQTAIQFTHVWQAYVVLVTGTCSLLLFANLIHKFFGPTEEKKKTTAAPKTGITKGYWAGVVSLWTWLRSIDPLISLPFIFIGVIGILSFITYMADRPNAQQRAFERMEMEIRSISRPRK